MFGFKTTNGRIQELEREVREAKRDNQDLKDQLEAKQEKIDQFDRTRALDRRKHDDLVQDIKHEHDRELDEREHEYHLVDVRADRRVAEIKVELDSLQAENEELRELCGRAADIARIELEQEGREAMIEAAEANIETIKQALANERNKTKQAREAVEAATTTAYEAGKADGEAIGRATGLVESAKTANEVTKQDRTNTHEVAMKVAEGTTNALAAVTSTKTPPVTVNNTVKSSDTQQG